MLQIRSLLLYELEPVITTCIELFLQFNTNIQRSKNYLKQHIASCVSAAYSMYMTQLIALNPFQLTIRLQCSVPLNRKQMPEILLFFFSCVCLFGSFQSFNEKCEYLCKITQHIALFRSNKKGHWSSIQ